MPPALPDGFLEDEDVDLFQQDAFLSSEEDVREESLWCSDEENLFSGEDIEEDTFRPAGVAKEARFLVEESHSEPDAAGCFLPNDSHAGQSQIPTRANYFWSPGSNCGRWVSRWNALAQQGQVLVANVYLNCTRLCSRAPEAARLVYRALSRSDSKIPRTNLSRRLASLLLGISTCKVQDVIKNIGSSWVPVAPQCSAEAA